MLVLVCKSKNCVLFIKNCWIKKTIFEFGVYTYKKLTELLKLVDFQCDAMTFDKNLKP